MNTLEEISFLNTRLCDIIYPIGSVVCLGNSQEPSDLFGTNTTWEKIPTNYSIKILNTSGTSGATSVSFTPKGTMNNTTLTSDQSPILYCAAASSTTPTAVYRGTSNTTYNLPSGQTTYCYADSSHSAASENHAHTAHGTAYGSYTWYFENIHNPTTPASSGWSFSLKLIDGGSTYYALCTPTQNHGLANVNQTAVDSVSHNHTMVVGTTANATSGHGHTITHPAVTFNLTNHPKINMSIWRRTG